jgi:acyl-CoA synthetase (AMP-forming)/AMP-acid ligase II
LSVRDLIRANLLQNRNTDALLASECGSFTYGQLSDQVEYVGKTLATLGIQRSDRVAVVLPNGPEMAVAFLGIAAFATCAPLNPSYRHDEFEFYLTDLGARAIVVPADTELAVRDVAMQRGLTVIDLEPSTPPLAGGFNLRGAAVDLEASPQWGSNEDVALVLHTSGTTSRPKLVPLSHRNLCSSARNIVQVLELSPDDRCLNVMPLFHIHGLVGVLLSSILAGASVVCCRNFDSRSFADLMGNFEPTWYSAVPTIHQAVLELAKANPAVASGGHLRLIRSSSSALPPRVMAELEQTFRVPVIESYGMTEAAHQMASNPLPPLERKPGSVGLPAGPEMAIMDDEGHLLPAGKTGEIVIRGTNVTAGYVDNPPASEAAFTDGWFRTGDRGRMDDQGYFYISGRTKEIINRGGENISPREIDEALLEHPAVAQVVAFAVPHPSLGEDVAAAVVLREGADVGEQDLREFGFARLADFKVPSQIVFVDAIPKGPTGKLQRIGLHEKLSLQLGREYVAPRTELEETLLELWREVLPVDQNGVHDNFFASGGDSLAAGRLVARINSQFELNLAVTTVFRAPSIADQAVLVEMALLDQIESE